MSLFYNNPHVDPLLPSLIEIPIFAFSFAKKKKAAITSVKLVWDSGSLGLNNEVSS